MCPHTGSTPDLLWRLGPNLMMSAPHRVCHSGSWMRPPDFPGAKPVWLSTPLHNFIVSGRKPIIVEGVTVSTIGQYCEGAHDVTKPMHQLWASEHIVDILKQHPQWPYICLEQSFLRVLKSEAFAQSYMAHAENMSILEQYV